MKQELEAKGGLLRLMNRGVSPPHLSEPPIDKKLKPWSQIDRLKVERNTL